MTADLQDMSALTTADISGAKNADRATAYMTALSE